MKSKTAYYRILGLIRDRMQYALVAGRYSPPYTIEAYLNRDKSKAFRCIAYQSAIRDVSALTEAATLLKIDAERQEERKR
jgi:hypothetical protein